MTGSPNLSVRFANAAAPLWIGFAIVVAAAFLTGCTTAPSTSPKVSSPQATASAVSETESSTPVNAVSQDELEERWGIEILGLRRSAGGYILDFRYRVIDPERAAPLFVRKTKPYLIDQASGRKVLVPNPPKVGPLRTSNKPQANRSYFILFANPGMFIKPGNKATIVIGDFRAENLIVE